MECHCHASGVRPLIWNVEDVEKASRAWLIEFDSTKVLSAKRSDNRLRVIVAFESETAAHSLAGLHVAFRCFASFSMLWTKANSFH
jgi:hypothetical protein